MEQVSLSDDNKNKITLAYVEMRRENTREGLVPLYQDYYDVLCEELKNTYWAPYSGRRSLEEQLKTYMKGRTPESIALGERIVTRARPGDSPHNWGCASDWAEFRPEFVGQEIWNKANWNEFGAAVRKVGLVWGGDFKSIIDKPHSELPLRVSWKQIGSIYMSEGKQAAIEAIVENAIYYGENK